MAKNMVGHRTPFIVGNWKMNLNHLEAIQVVQKFTFALPREYFEQVDVAVIPPFTDIRSVQTIVDGDKLELTYGAQDISQHENGAYTGEVSASMLAKLGCKWVLVGHSERREHHGEDDAQVANKAKIAIKYGISPVVCVGEPLEVREAGNHIEFVVEQMKASLADLSAEDLGKIVLAYEPVWAIGTGKVASAGDAQAVCAAIRETLVEIADEDTAQSVRILYGGSVNRESIGELVAQPDIDGGLVGGASLDGAEFARLVAAAVSQ